MSLWDALEKAAYTGLGLAALTRAKLEEAVDRLKKERGLSEEEGRKLMEEMKESAESARKKLDEHVGIAVRKTLDRMNLAAKDDIKALQARIAELEKRLEENPQSGS